jgi:hypothetical protein
MFVEEIKEHRASSSAVKDQREGRRQKRKRRRKRNWPTMPTTKLESPELVCFKHTSRQLTLLFSSLRPHHITDSLSRRIKVKWRETDRVTDDERM